jgi:hypothetical protein
MMKDGKHVVAKSLKRQGDNIMATDPAENGGIAMHGDVGYPLAQVEKLEFPEPAQIKSTPDLIVSGKAAEALAQLDAALRYYDSFRDAPAAIGANSLCLSATRCSVLAGRRSRCARPTTLSRHHRSRAGARRARDVRGGADE